MYGPSGIAIISLHVNTIDVTQIRTSLIQMEKIKMTKNFFKIDFFEVFLK